MLNLGLPFDPLPAAEPTQLGRLVWDPATQQLTTAPTTRPEAPTPVRTATPEQFGGEGQPAFVADINGQRVTAGRMVRDPNTGLLEPDYGDIMPVDRPSMPDPITLADIQSRAAIEQTAAMFNSKRAELQNSIRPAEESAWRDAQIDLKTINESNLDADQKKQRIRQLQANYEKKVYGIRDKIRGDLDGLAQMEEQARSKIELERLTTEAGLRHVAAFGKDIGASPEDISRWQYKALGIRLPEPSTPIAQTPVQRLGELRPILHRAIQMASNYKPHPTKPKEWLKLDPISKDRFPRNPDKWYKSITNPAEALAAEDSHLFLADIQAQVDELERIVGNRPQPSILSGAEHAMSPMGKGVQTAKPKTAAPTTPRIRNDAEYDALPSGAYFIDPMGVRRRKP